jgi:hypothetical protein
MVKRLLVACECSDRVRSAFEVVGWDAWSCDLQGSRSFTEKHLKTDVRNVLGEGWDMMIAHPPCTYLSYAGARWWGRADYPVNRHKALALFRELLNAPIPQICIENPRGIAAQLIRSPDDVVEPFEFGDPFKKRTYLWLVNLPPLMRTLQLTWYENDWTTSVTKDRQFTRSTTFQGIAGAMAHQWGR